MHEYDTKSAVEDNNIACEYESIGSFCVPGKKGRQKLLESEPLPRQFVTAPGIDREDWREERAGRVMVGGGSEGSGYGGRVE